MWGGNLMMKLNIPWISFRKLRMGFAAVKGKSMTWLPTLPLPSSWLRRLAPHAITILEKISVIWHVHPIKQIMYSQVKLLKVQVWENLKGRMYQWSRMLYTMSTQNSMRKPMTPAKMFSSLLLVTQLWHSCAGPGAVPTVMPRSGSTTWGAWGMATHHFRLPTHSPVCQKMRMAMKITTLLCCHVI